MFQNTNVTFSLTNKFLTMTTRCRYFTKHAILLSGREKLVIFSLPTRKLGRGDIQKDENIGFFLTNVLANSNDNA